jgi:pimeloyl-ACP methyl ester carboxylesterase
LSLDYQFYRSEEFTVPYLTVSNGDKPMLAFHGYAQSAKDLQYFDPVLNGMYNAIGVNHFFHEQAKYPANRKHGQPLEIKEIGELYMNIPTIKNADKISLLGYSMGGKTALALMELYPEKIDKVYLMAPDGLYMNPWYKFIVFTAFGRKLMKTTLHRPKVYFNLSKLVYKLGFVSEKLYHYFNENMKSEKARFQVYDTWLAYRNVIPDLNKIVANINKYNIETHLIFGEFDSIITPKIGERFQIKSDFIHLHKVPCGHMMNNEKVKKVFQHLINSSSK